MRKFFIAAALAVVSMIGASASADAAFQIRVSYDGGTTWGAPVVGTETAFPEGTVGSVPQFSVASFTVAASATSGISTGMTTLDLQVNGGIQPAAYNIVIQASFNGTARPLRRPKHCSPSSLASILPAGSGLTATAETWVANGTTLFQTGPVDGSVIVGDTGTLVPQGNGGQSFSLPHLYTITAQITIKGTSTTPFPGATVSLDSNNHITRPQLRRVCCSVWPVCRSSV